MNAHRTLAAFADCGCLAAAAILGLDAKSDASIYREAAKWSREGHRIEHMEHAAFKALPWRCPGHPDGRWDEKGRVRPLIMPSEATP